VSKKHHWVGEVDPDKYYGFVYLITNTVSGRKYIGRKFYHIYKKRKRVRESNWRVYAGSCKPLKEDMQRIGKDKFTFEIICNYKTRGGVVSGEVHFQTDNDVLSPELLPCGERLYYNAQLGAVKFIAPEFHSAETRAKMSASRYKGPYIITFKDGHTEEWIKLKNIDGYDDSNLYQVLYGHRKFHKDIVKVERIGSDDK
jgi:hypothetical protein